MTRAELRTYTRKELVVLAKKHRIAGWHPMKKEELIRALVSATRSSRPRRNGHSDRQRAASAAKTSGARSSNGHSGGGKQSVSADCKNGHHHASARATANPAHDRLLARVCDPYWLQVRWEISALMMARAEAALGVEWHQSQLVIRLFDVTTEDVGTSATTHVRDLELRADVKHWFVEVDDPTHSYRLQIGYRAPSGKFFVLARSNTVRTSRPGANPAIDRVWNDDHDEAKPGKNKRSRTTNGSADKTARLSHDRLSSSRGLAGLGNGAAASSSDDQFEFQFDAELIVSGVTNPEASLSILGTSIPLLQDGSFELRVGLPEGRQVIPAVAVTPNGREERTIVLAIERNTKVLEPHCFDEI